MERGELENLITAAVQAATKDLVSSIQSLRADVQVLKVDLEAKDKKIAELENRLVNRMDEMEQYGRRNNLRIFGVSESDNEDTDDPVLSVASKLGLTLDAACIDRSHRLGKKGLKVRPIIVKFVSYSDRRLMFGVKKKLKGTKLTIREDLASQRYRLLRDAIASYSEKRVWSLDGVIKVDVGLRFPLSVRTHEQLQDMLVKHPPSTLKDK